ncbi:hypothetical protein DOTSEDRAFT_80025 [Dothistroma septosporum NZE10]|uniref:histidine kinase n=1 Tax=Dothistroma septosporum (strain NZE10 / CBS 128990) TaxID=675120 RepID=N1PMP7_DOTSN|nr:hypothetical protein DOTSEDRAFT_80025 [Dothistroma septosporum NZE10]
MRGSRTDKVAASSRDVSLTAFAQLVALRLNVKRALVSLFDKNSQYVLAEATQTLSLQDDEVHDEGDGLNWGNTVMSRGDDFASETLKLAKRLKHETGAGAADAALTIPDFEKHDRFSDHPHVLGAPFLRSFAGVPLLAPSGFPIGTLSIMHDQARPQGLTQDQLTFMRDVGISVMEHIEMKRIETASWRGTRMVNGLSRFMEGKDSVDEDELPEGNEPGTLAKRQDLETSKLGASARTQALNSATNIERMSSARDSKSWRTQTSKSRRDHAVAAPPIEARRASRPGFDPLQTSTPRSGSSSRCAWGNQNDAQSGPSALQENTVSKDAPQAFGRAASIIRQAMNIAGVIFLDASAKEFGSLRSPGAGTVNSDTSETGSTDGEESGQEKGSFLSASTSKPCRYLGTSYQASEDGTIDVFHHHVPERFLRSVLRRYPQGKIYNFSDDGLLPSDDGSDSSTSLDKSTKEAGEKPRKPRRSSYTDSLELQNVFPGARALGVMPMWDALRGRFFAGAVVWTYDRQRLFSFQEDLNYLGAFCDVVMAEVTRLDIQADVRAKVSFISSISHELRSPLHGILGGVEVLQEEGEDVASRQQMISMIDTCGRSLLDIVNNLLEHAYETTLSKHGRAGVERRRKEKLSNTSQDVHDLAQLVEEVLDSALWQTPQPAPRSQSSESIAVLNSLISHEPLKVTLDVDIDNLPDTGWSFHVNAGAFRRLLQNLTMNAIKYTDQGGYFKVGLSVSRSSPEYKFRTVILVCTDSGRGMSEEYLRNGLYQAFHQEDSHTEGTGLGLNLVKGLIEGMAGSIDVRSTKGKGTTITLRLPLTPGQPTEDWEPYHDRQNRVKGLKYSLIGFGASANQGTRAATASDILKETVEKAFTDSGMGKCDDSANENHDPDIYVLTGARAMIAASAMATEKQAFQTKPCIIFCDSISSSRATTAICSGYFAQAQAVAQPLGPTKLIKAVIACFDKAPADPNPQRTTSSASGNPQHKRQQFAFQTPVREFSEMSWTQTFEDRSRSREPSPRASARPSIRADASAVLIVDDNPVNLHLLQRYIKKIGRVDVGATNGQEALEAYERSHRPQNNDETEEMSTPTEQANLPVSVIFTDITMPIMDGLESTRRIRAFERAGGLEPAMVVALTAMASPQARQEAYGSGVDLFLTKPVRFKKIEQMFKDWEAEMGEGRVREA